VAYTVSGVLESDEGPVDLFADLDGELKWE
jgi:hypothetical protein